MAVFCITCCVSSPRSTDFAAVRPEIRPGAARRAPPFRSYSWPRPWVVLERPCTPLASGPESAEPVAGQHLRHAVQKSLTLPDRPSEHGPSSQPPYCYRRPPLAPECRKLRKSCRNPRHSSLLGASSGGAGPGNMAAAQRRLASPPATGPQTGMLGRPKRCAERRRSSSGSELSGEFWLAAP
jgi:hypothetical protein